MREKHGAWRSLASALVWDQEVEGSNPFAPTFFLDEPVGEHGANDMKKSATTKGESPSRLIDARIKELGDWRGKTLSHVRALIKQADP